MLHKTRGIVLKTTDYSESSVVVQIFTEKFGLQSYIINGVKKPRAKVNRNMLQPLHLVDMVVYHKESGSIQRISEMRNAPVLVAIPYDIVKSSLVMFLNEVLYKAIKQQTAEEHLFAFIFNAVEWLDHATDGLANFHLIFLIQLSRYLGFYPHKQESLRNDYFDMRNGIFTNYRPDGGLYLSPPHTGNFNTLLQVGFEQLPDIRLSNDERRYLIERLLEYYALHIEGFGNIRSHEVLEEVLS